MTTFADRVKDTTTTAGTGSITLAQTLQDGFQLFGTAFPAISTVTYCISSRTTTDWEIGSGLFTPPNTLTRSPTSSSNANAVVNFGAEAKDVFVTQSASNINKLQSSSVIPFAVVIPLTQSGIQYMPQQTVNGPLQFSVSTTLIQNASVYLRLISNGVNTPTFATGLKEWGGSLGYDSRSGVINYLQLFHDGYDTFYSWAQYVGATAIDTTPPTALSSAVANASPSVVNITMSEALNAVNIPAISAFVIGGHTISSIAISGSTINLTVSAAFVNAEAASTISYTQPGTGGATDIAGNLLVSFSGLAITNNVGAAATAPGAPTGVIATAGGASASLTCTAPANNGNSALTGYTFISSPVGGVDSNAGTLTLPHLITGLTNGVSYTFTATASNAIGTSITSAASNSVTPAPAIAFPTLTDVWQSNVSGTGPYTYAVQSANFSDVGGGVFNKHLPANADGSFIFRCDAFGAFYAYLIPTANRVDFSSRDNSIACPDGPFQYLGGATATAQASINGTNGDYVKIERTLSSGADFTAVLKWYISKDNGSTYTQVYMQTGYTTAARWFMLNGRGGMQMTPMSSTGTVA